MAAGGGGKNTAAKSNSKRAKPQNTLRRHHRKQNLSQLITQVASATSAAHSFLSRNDLHLLPSQTLTLESKISSTALSLSKLLSLPTPPPPLSPSPPSPPPPCWFDRFLSAASDDYDTRWTDAFRMSKPSFSLLLRLLNPSLNSLSPLPPDYALAAALFRLSHGASYKTLSHRFGLESSSAACRTFYTVCKTINEKLGHMFEFRSDINRIIVGFGWISLPNCCGVLGFDQFQIEGDLLGENGSLIVQALVDSEGRFLDVSAGWPSTMKLETILRHSKLFLGVEESGELLNGPSFELNNGDPIPQYILGDSCFPLFSWLLTPFTQSDGKIQLSSSERAFNSVHNRGMELVDTAFGRVRARWQLLSKRWNEECIESFPFVVMTCCLLHNFLIKCSEVLPDDDVDYSRDRELSVFDGEVDESGRRIRDALASYFGRVNQRR